ATEAYKQCLDVGKSPSELDDWFKNRARRKLDGLLGENLAPNSCPDTNVSE
ncbi:unnamed protein product, partial [marine sediment metagenome]